MSEINIYNRDCIEAMAEMEENTMNLTVTSPPYDDLRTYSDGFEGWGERKWKDTIKHLYRITIKGGVVVWIVQDQTNKDGGKSGTSFKQALFAKECGFNIHDVMIWQKTGFSSVGSLSSRYAPVFEYMFVFSKGKPKTFNPIKDRLNLTYGQKNTGGIQKKDGSMRQKSGQWKEIGLYGQRFNVWEITQNERDGYGHPAPFPKRLAGDMIKSWSFEADIVFDPFMGCGTTGEACIDLKRRFFGIEVSKEYFNIAKRRLENHQRQHKLF